MLAPLNRTVHLTKTKTTFFRSANHETYLAAVSRHDAADHYRDPLWYLAAQPIPTTDEIWVITSGVLHKRLAQVLLGADSPLLALCQDYHLPPILFDEQHILVPKKDGQPLMDIRTCEEQSIITDFITNKVQGVDH